MHLDLSDLTTVKPAAASFTAQEDRLDVIWHNAGAGFPPGSVTKQGLEAHMGSGCVAPLLLTHELLPLLQAAARTAPRDSVRVVWTGSVMIQTEAPQGGVDFARIEKPTSEKETVDYAACKAANWFLAAEGARRWGKDGIISVCQNPGNLNTAIQDGVWNRVMLAIVRTILLYDAKYGAYTMLFSGLSPEVNEGANGAYIWPFGRIKPVPRADILQAASEGRAKDFWEWCERSWRKYV